MYRFIDRMMHDHNWKMKIENSNMDEPLFSKDRTVMILFCGFKKAVELHYPLISSFLAYDDVEKDR